MKMHTLYAADVVYFAQKKVVICCKIVKSNTIIVCNW